MTRLGAEEFVPARNRFRWEAFLPKRKAWIQTLILLPFGVHVANFLGASWQFSANAIGVEQQYLLGAISMVINLLLPSLFFACLFHGGSWVLGKQESSTWYPKTRALSAGAAATLTIAVSFGMVGLLTHSFGICRNPAAGNVAQSLLCNLDNYNFESKSWFGAWFIVAAYCYQAQSSIESRIAHRHRNYPPRFTSPEHDFAAAMTGHDDYHANPSTEAIGNGED
ncbi:MULTISPECIES: hypothetical protein [unclassified Chamaesiphon]|uniref:hypothetical protein n=1 Tax=unclassified Chamaesiphon TaxID=2620921 RepID=UPI00286B3598|nr:MULTISPECIES: hypothetical protein [unclassified Chamaesiphon]